MESELHGEKQYNSWTVEIDGTKHSLTAQTVDGRQILEIANKRPVDDYIVYSISENNVLEDLGLEKVVTLSQKETHRFLTFHNDRSYRFEIDGDRQDWGAPTITEETLRHLARAKGEDRIWLERKKSPDKLIEQGEFVDLSEPGIEKFYTERSYFVTIVNEDNGHEFQLEAVRNSLIATLIERMYKKMNLARREDDRLRCEENGGDVLTFAQIALGQYIDSGHCPCLVWLFAGGTGGASCL
jgi:hypothetical protein